MPYLVDLHALTVGFSVLSRVIVPNARRRIRVLSALLTRLSVLYSMTPLRLPKLAPLENYIVL